MEIIAHIRPTLNDKFVVKDGGVHATVTKIKWIKDYIYKCDYCDSDECTHVKYVKEFSIKS